MSPCPRSHEAEEPTRTGRQGSKETELQEGEVSDPIASADFPAYPLACTYYRIGSSLCLSRFRRDY
jgi:hypothetical protein